MMILSFKGVKGLHREMWVPWIPLLRWMASIVRNKRIIVKTELSSEKMASALSLSFFTPPFVLAMSQLNDSLKNFKKNLSASTLVGVKRTATARPADHSHTTKHTSINNNTRASFEHAHQESRKKQKKATGSLIGLSGTIAGMMTIVVLL